MSNKVPLDVKVDETLKKAAEDVFALLGITMSTAINLYLNQVVVTREIPFPITTERSPMFSAKNFNSKNNYYNPSPPKVRRVKEWEIPVMRYDEGISGTNTKHRAGFNRMIRDALDGKIDLIVTKSISRFARNTVDTLTNVRTLKEHNVEVYFEKENIYTFDTKGEVLITIMSSLAQEESRSISENVTWGHRKRFSDGKISLAYSSFLGYEKGPDKDHPLVIVEDQAVIVRRIYTMFIDGKTPFTIAKPSPTKTYRLRAARTNGVLLLLRASFQTRSTKAPHFFRRSSR